MSRIVFFEKPGCAGNGRQRAWLEQAGHAVERRDLLREPWTPASLLDFLAPLPVAEWFNRAAPRVKSGEVVPETLDRDAALALLLEQPLLIRRPLMRREDGGTMVGFDAGRVQAWVGLEGAALPRSTEGCIASGCADPAAAQEPKQE